MGWGLQKPYRSHGHTFFFTRNGTFLAALPRSTNQLALQSGQEKKEKLEELKFPEFQRRKISTRFFPVTFLGVFLSDPFRG